MLGLLGCLLGATLWLACGAALDETRREPPSSTPENAAPAPVATLPPVEATTVIVFLGDSLTAGYGLEEQQAFPAVIGERLAAEGHDVRVINAGVSGDTTAGGLSRLDWLLRQEPDVVVVSLGANDGLRGLPPETTEDNLRQIVRRIQASGARALLTGMLVPPNYGRDYATRFAAIFPTLAAELEVPLVPFLLTDVAAVAELNLADGIHPNPEGQRRVAENVLPALVALLDDEAATASPPAP